MANATLEVDGGISLAENIELNVDSNLVNVSGDNAITQTLLIKSNANIDMQGGSLAFNPDSGNAVNADVGATPALNVLGSGDLVFKEIFNLGNQLDPSRLQPRYRQSDRSCEV